MNCKAVGQNKPVRADAKTGVSDGSCELSETFNLRYRLFELILTYNWSV